jgi:hypothetical protein
MTTATVINLFGRYLEFVPREMRTKELPEVTIEDMLKVSEEESQLAHDLEVERQVDYALIEKENN